MAVRREYLRALKAVLEEAGATEITFDYKKRRTHPRLTFNLAGAHYARIVPASPSDNRALKNDLAILRRIIKGHAQP